FSRGKWPVLAGSMVLRARGNKHLKAVHVAKLNKEGGVDSPSEQQIACDLLCLASGLQPAHELLYQGGMRFRFDAGRWIPSQAVPGLWAAGAAAGTFDLPAQVLEGWQRGKDAAAALGYGGLAEGLPEWEARKATTPAQNSEAPSLPALSALTGR